MGGHVRKGEIDKNLINTKFGFDSVAVRLVCSIVVYPRQHQPLFISVIVEKLAFYSSMQHVLTLQSFQIF